MSEAYAREILKRNVAQICQTIGWGGINSMPLDILVHVLEKYMRTLGSQVGRYAEQFERTEPNLNDLGLVFNDLNVQLPEILDYCKSVPPVPAPFDIDKFPKSKESHLNFLKPGSHEVVTRPVHVHEHLPPMYPEKERDTPLVADTVEIHQNGMDPSGSRSPEISVTDSPEKAKDIFKRPSDPVSLHSNKRPRLRLDEEERTREISSVMMTMSGFLSPAREGKLPEAKAPIIVSEKHDRHKTSSHSNILKGALHPSLDKKSKKSKLANGKIMKSKRKDKSHKGDSSKSKESKHHPSHSGLKSKDIPLVNQNNFAMPLPKSLPPAMKPIVPPIPSTLENMRPIKQEPLDHPPLLPNKNQMTREDSIPVPRRIPISKSPLIPNSFTNKIHSANALHPETTIKKEKLDEEEKLSSQPDRSKVNIFKRISNKANTSEVVQDKSQSSSVFSRLPNTSTDSNNFKVKTENNVVNNNDESAVDYSQVMDLTTNEVISLDDDFDVNIYPNRRHIVEPRPNPLAINKNLQFPFPKDQPTASPKIKKERKHKEKKDKTAEKVAKLEAKLLKKQQQQMSMEMAQAEKQALKLAKKKKSKPKNDPTKHTNLPPGFPFFPNIPTGRGLPNPGLIPDGDFLAGLANNPALRGLPHPNLLANPFALNAGPGLIPGPMSDLMSGSVDLTGNHNSMMNLPNFGHSSRTPTSKIPTMLRRPSLEVIPVDQDDDRGYNVQSAQSERNRIDKHKSPNILKNKKSHKDHKVNLSKMPPVQPDVTIELNPPKPVVIQEQINPEPVKEPPKPVPVKIPSPEPIRKQAIVPEVNVETIPVQLTNSPDDKDLDKLEKKKDKSHKKEKKDKDGIKIKKKKDKKDKNKDKSEKKKEEKHELKEKLKKERKEKKKAADGLVPKLTLKLGSSSPVPPSSPDVFKLNIKPVVKQEDEDDDISLVKEESESRGGSRSPELAQISALVTRPPKPKHPKHNNIEEPKSPPPSSSSPTRKNRPPSGHKFKRILFKTLAKKGQAENFDDEDEVDSVEEKPPQPTPDKSTGQLPTPFYVDEHGNKVWVCPACGRQDNGSPMIGCDGCDGWYHWVCVGITEEPGATEDWFCRSCVAKRASMVFAGKKRGRKSKGDKVRDCN